MGVRQYEEKVPIQFFQCNLFFANALRPVWMSICHIFSHPWVAYFWSWAHIFDGLIKTNVSRNKSVTAEFSGRLNLFCVVEGRKHQGCIASSCVLVAIETFCTTDRMQNMWKGNNKEMKSTDLLVGNVAHTLPNPINSGGCCLSS